MEDDIPSHANPFIALYMSPYYIEANGYCSHFCTLHESLHLTLDIVHTYLESTSQSLPFYFATITKSMTTPCGALYSTPKKYSTSEKVGTTTEHYRTYEVLSQLQKMFQPTLIR